MNSKAMVIKYNSKPIQDIVLQEPKDWYDFSLCPINKEMELMFKNVKTFSSVEEVEIFIARTKINLLGDVYCINIIDFVRAYFVEEKNE